MNQFRTVLVLAAGLAVASCAWGQMASSGMAGTYANIEASSLRKRPQDAWARSIAFRDQITVAAPGKPQRLDRRTFFPIELKNAGTAWVREDRFPSFQALPANAEFTFGGTVDQFNRRYYIILDAAYQVETLPTQEERWTDVLANPPVPPSPDIFADNAGDLPEPPVIDIPAEPPSWSDVMTGIVDITEPAPEAEPENWPLAENEPEPEPEADFPADAAEDIDAYGELDDSGNDGDDELADISGFAEAEPIDEEPGEETIEPPAPLPIEVAEMPPAVEAVSDFDVPASEPDLGLAPEDDAEEQTEVAVVAEEDTLETETDPLVLVEESAVGEEDDLDMVIAETPETAEPFDVAENGVDFEGIYEPNPEPVPIPEAVSSDSYHVGPMGEDNPVTLVPLVSLQPTKAELLAQEIRRREAERQEVLRQKEAVRQAKIEAKRQREAEAKRAKAEAAARKKAEAEIRAELERARQEAEAARRAEEQRLREEEARAVAAMEAREAQERDAAAKAAARKALQKERDDLAARIAAEKAALAERSRMAREVLAAEQAARDEAERAAREDAELQQTLLAEKARLEADLAALASRQAELDARLAAGHAAREEAERLAREEDERTEAARIAVEQREADERAARKAAKQAAKQAKRERAAARAEGDLQAVLDAEAAASGALDAIGTVDSSAPVASPKPAPAADVPDWMKPVFF